MSKVILTVILSILLFSTRSHSENIDQCQLTTNLLEEVAYNPAVGSYSELDSLVRQERNFFELKGLENAYCRELNKNLRTKITAHNRGMSLSKKKIIDQSIWFESFRITKYLSSAVAPKKYFGFLDLEGDTSEYEKVLRETIISGTKLANNYAEEENLNTRITEKEVLVTFLAEGGALMLTDPDVSINRIHPVNGIGLDNFRLGLKKYPQLVDSFDKYFGTKLNSLTFNLIGYSLLIRPMTFKESILGTIFMYLYQKDLTYDMLFKDRTENLMSLDLDEQFIVTSLVYNSGILFSKERISQIREFATSSYLSEINLKSDRPKLKIYPPGIALEMILTEGIPQQLTSWNAVYHILQRYGAWVSLDLYADYFKDGFFLE